MGQPSRNRYFRPTATSSSSANERLQINTGMLLIITNTADEIFGGTNMDDLKQTKTLKIKIKGFENFLRF